VGDEKESAEEHKYLITMLRARNRAGRKIPSTVVVDKKSG